jgi:hypothetical protein
VGLVRKLTLSVFSSRTLLTGHAFHALVDVACIVIRCRIVILIILVVLSGKRRCSQSHTEDQTEATFSTSASMKYQTSGSGDTFDVYYFFLTC